MGSSASQPCALPGEVGSKSLQTPRLPLDANMGEDDVEDDDEEA